MTGRQMIVRPGKPPELVDTPQAELDAYAARAPERLADLRERTKRIIDKQVAMRVSDPKVLGAQQDLLVINNRRAQGGRPLTQAELDQETAALDILSKASAVRQYGESMKAAVDATDTPRNPKRIDPDEGAISGSGKWPSI